MSKSLPESVEKPTATWRPSASLTALRRRARLLADIRVFFRQRDVWEIETPLLSETTATDPHIESLQTQDGLYLQTSPEFAMKRLLAAGSGAIFQICKAFRHEETGARHRREFTMLEWYRPGFDHHRLMAEVEALLQAVCGWPACTKISYQKIFARTFNVNPLNADIPALKATAARAGIEIPETADIDDCLNLMFACGIEPQLQKPTLVYNYPRSQAALARINDDIAERFELYAKGIEIANGFHELANAAEQRQRFTADLQKRRQLGRTLPRQDKRLLAALTHGLPDCAGVALGVDRLLMAMLDFDNIGKTMSFDDESSSRP